MESQSQTGRNGGDGTVETALGLAKMVLDDSGNADPVVSLSRSDASTTQEASTSMDQRYRYSPLDEKAHQIRLLTLYPGQFTDEIRISLEVVSFTDDFHTCFEALSYTWGSLENPVEIAVGETGNDFLPVTQNLAQALPYLRLEDAPVVLWIDAICVNQQDLEERSSQARFMAQIYSKAPRVLIWSGLESEDSRMAIETLKLIANKFSVDWDHLAIRSTTQDGIDWEIIDEALPLEDEAHLSILNLLDRDWFERLWIWQEAHLANDKALVLCGNVMILWKTLCEAVFCFFRKSAPRFCYSAHVFAYHKVRRLFIKLPPLLDFHQLVERTQSCKCSDPQDRIFALMGLNRHNSWPDIEPDYTKDVKDVYKDFALSLMTYSDNLELLRSIEFHDRSRLLSWVPDWSISRKTRRFMNDQASGLSTAKFMARSGNTLQVTGVSVSKVLRAEPLDVKENDTATSEIVSKLQLVTTRIGLHNTPRQPSEYLRELSEVLCMNTFLESFVPSKVEYLTRSRMETGLCAILTDPDNVTNEQRHHTTWFSGYWSNRCLFLTEDYHVGLAPKDTQPGDIVVVLLGCSSTMLLRPVNSNDPPQTTKQYRVIGEAYCYGIMHNESLIGPLPESFEPVVYFKENLGAYMLGFIDRATGVVSPDDPRLRDVQLPEPWAKLNVDKEEIFVNGSTGKKTRRDPRLTADALRERGVKLEVFDLI
ncbi:hypothetical protein VTL71DRAFT_1062 [Oculimacula yallundae]|uniref:Heterokaryon incompatibility domain-containing protein n=1 Tax=Oculimacula yallundae TaxID=86028 RepID=A0ABR4D1T0_9HELO